MTNNKMTIFISNSSRSFVIRAVATQKPSPTPLKMIPHLEMESIVLRAKTGDRQTDRLSGEVRSTLVLRVNQQGIWTAYMQIK